MTDPIPNVNISNYNTQRSTANRWDEWEKEVRDVIDAFPLAFMFRTQRKSCKHEKFINTFLSIKTKTECYRREVEK